MNRTEHNVHVDDRRWWRDLASSYDSETKEV